MKIKEEIERECCQHQDLKPYRGLVNEGKPGSIIPKAHRPVFCIHCGQIWIHTREMGPAGSMDPSMEKIEI